MTMTTSQSETLAVGQLNLPKGGVASGSISELCRPELGQMKSAIAHRRAQRAEPFHYQDAFSADHVNQQLSSMPTGALLTSRVLLTP